MTEENPRKLPVFRISWEAYRFVFRHALSLVKLAWLPFLVVSAARATPIYFLVTHGPPYSGIWSWVTNTVFLFAFPALVAVNWHRYVLLGSRPIGSLDGFKIGKPEVLFLGITAVLIVMTSSAPDITAKVLTRAFGPDNEREITSYFFLFLLLPLFLLAFCRFYILLPITAIGDRPSVSRVWRLTKANTFRIFSIICLTSGLSGVTLNLVITYFSRALLFDSLYSMEAVHPLLVIYATGATVSSLTAIFCGSLGATALSLCYRKLTIHEDIVAVFE